ncbi:hypothetical protein EJ03DRAFT_18914 [Teratosphaeria nubilosa]|uniref:Uncharacterized protein n=1 Tax=Teratosphaeria nubilosa TaxID=161662 RepID=A0A6G1KVI7_9PEZI|nr:hypothetical protein EJ03DRAFT_18914 [Teratosphaeria nubilosa]
MRNQDGADGVLMQDVLLRFAERIKMAEHNSRDLLFVPLSPSLEYSSRRHYCYPWERQNRSRFFRRRGKCGPMGVFEYAKKAVTGKGEQESGSLQISAPTKVMRLKSSWRKGEERDEEQYSEKAALQQPPTSRTARETGSRNHQSTSQPAQPGDRYSQSSLMDFDNLQQSLIAHHAQQTLITTPHHTQQASDFDRLRKEILSNCWALLYLQHARPADIDPVLVVESSLPPAYQLPRSKHSAHTVLQSRQDSAERFTAVVANQGQPFIQGAAGASHGEALEMLLAATTEAVHANRHRFFFSANHRKNLVLERSGGVIDAGSVAGAAFVREKMRRKAT